MVLHCRRSKHRVSIVHSLNGFLVVSPTRLVPHGSGFMCWQSSDSQFSKLTKPKSRMLQPKA
jgi:hypothetical protein